MSETPSLTFKQKEENKIFILNNLDDYIVDIKGHFFNTQKELGEDHWYILRDAVNDYWEVIEEFIQKILSDKKNWKPCYRGYECPSVLKHLVSGKEIEIFGFGSDNRYYLLGEIGYRDHYLWKNYDDDDHPTCIKKVALITRTQRLNKNYQSEPTKEKQKESEKPKNDSSSNQEPKPQPPNNSLNQETNQDNQEQINNLKKEQTTSNPQQYGEDITKTIEQKLEEHKIKIEDLTNENQQALQKLKEGQITDPTQLVATETNLKENIYQVETQNKITNFTTRVNKVLKDKNNSNKSQIETLKKELLEFISSSSSSSSNLYYTPHQKTIKNLLNKLENHSNRSKQSNNNASISPSSVPWKVIVPVLVVGVLLVGIVVLRAKGLLKLRKRESK